MRLLRLTIRNIASIENATIDFCQPAFAGESIFLIYGETGSGKSTILDAICLALYKKTPRLETASGNVYVDEAFTKRGGGEVQSSTSDVEQYIRRGVRPGDECYSELLFEANDGQNYTARLEFRLTNTGNLKETVWTLTMPDGRELRGKGAGNSKEGISDKVVSPVINQLVGLDYRQFCRTTMLAQGEFTKFLKANDRERCEILEKITDTGRFKRIGEALAERLSAELRRLEAIRTERDGLPIRSEAELTAIRVALHADQARLSFLDTHIRVLNDRATWIEREGTLTERMQQTQTTLQQARAEVQSDAYRHRQQGIAEWRATERERQAVAKIDDILRKTPDLEQLLHNEQDAAVQRTNRLRELETSMQQAKAALEKVDLSALTLRQNALNARGRDAELLRTILNEITEREQAWRTQQQEVERLRTAVEKAVVNRQQAEAEQTNREQLWRQCEKRYGEMSERLGHAAALVAQLQEGDRCPVCGNIYRALEQEDLLAPLRLERDEAEQRYQQAVQTVSTMRLAETDARTAHHLAETTLGNHLQLLRQSQSQRTEVATRLALVADSATLATDLASLIETTGTELTALARQIAEVTPLQKQYNDSVQSYQQLLRQDHEAQQRVRQLESDRDERDRCRQILSQSAIPEARIRQLAKASLAYVENLDRQQAEANNRLTEAQTLWRNLLQEHAQHRLSPYAWGRTDRDEIVRQRMAAETERLTVTQRMGGHRQLLQTNSEYEQRARQLDEQARAQQQVVHSWDLVCRDFSGKSKDRFSRIAQGYILRELLEYANEYLARFTSRYLLSIQTDSTAILVRDLHSGGLCRPVDMLSGGESFMISLSLALALIRLGSTTFRVDTLFIDEGFGTLDGRSLETVINTLERLQELSGRKVGVISHVKELRQRIGMRIAVRRKPGSQSISEIEIEH